MKNMIQLNLIFIHFHFSDGDNLTSDNVRCVKLVEELMKVSNMFGYGEVNQYNRHSYSYDRLQKY